MNTVHCPKGVQFAVLVAMASSLLWQPQASAAQPWVGIADPTFQHPRSDTEPPALLVLTIAQDHDGFMWIGTESGVLRWDGYHYRVYSSDRKDPAALPDNYVRALHVDSHGELWIGTLSGGLSRYDRRNDRFINYYNGPEGISSIDVRAIADDGAGGVWAATSHGLDEVSAERGVIRHMVHDNAAAGSLPEDKVRAVIRDGKGRLWVGARNSVVHQDISDGPLLRIDVPLPVGERLDVRSLYEDSHGRIWIGTGRGAYVIAPDTGSAGPRLVAGSESDQIESFTQGAGDEVWLGTSGNGLLIVDTTTWAIRHIRHDPMVPQSLDGDTLYSLYRDRAGDVWLGTNRGLSRHDPNQQALLSLFGVAQRKTGISDGDVESVLPTPDGRLWLGLGALGGVDVLDPFAGRVAQIRTALDLRGKPVALGEVRGLALTPSGRVFLCARNGLYHATLSDLLPRQIPLPGVLGMRAEALAADNETLWLGSIDDGLWMLKLNGRDEPQPYLRPDRLTDPRISSIVPDSSGSVWVGTFNGLNRVDPMTDSVERISANPDSPANIAAPYVSAILIDRRSRVWVGTLGGGISLLEGRTPAGSPQFRHIGAAEGLPNSNVDKLLEAPSGTIWVATDAGLAVIDPVSLTVRPLLGADGVAISTYWTNAGALTRDGTLAFGGAGGLTLVRAEYLTTNSRHPPVVVTEARVGGTILPWGKFAVEPEPTPIQIVPEANSVAVEVASLDYSAPERNRYAYWLEGYDHGWIEADARHRTVAYTNLPPGGYVLHLRGSNRDGVWTEKSIALPVLVQRGWYQTIWFKAAVILALLATTLVLIRSRTAYLRARQRELERVVATQTAQLRARERQLEQLAYRDPLTGLGNRRMLTRQFDQTSALMSKGDPFALLLIDLDRFKQINDSWGHDAGDALLVEVSRRLKAAARHTDHVFRIGGDEFVILFGGLDSATVETVCRRIIRSLSAAIAFNGAAMSTSPSIGIARFPADGTSLEALFKSADLALYEAKHAGRNTWRWVQTAREHGYSETG
jgi:diguanylate cyclase (GGDEF)-like protein